MNDQLKDNEIFMEQPDSCKVCGWKPVVANNEEQEVAIKNCWLLVPIPNSPAWLFICPNCANVWANKNCVKNAEKLIKLKETRSPILKPSDVVKPVPTLILPGKGHIGRN